MKSKYELLKKIYPKHVIIFIQKGKYTSIGKDKIIYEHNKNLKYNHIIVENLLK